MRILRIIALAGAVAAYVNPPQRETRPQTRRDATQTTLERPVLQATVALAANLRWIDGIWRQRPRGQEDACGNGPRAGAHAAIAALLSLA